MKTLDKIDCAYVEAALTLRLKLSVPLVGDFVRIGDKVERFAYDWGDLIQTTEGGSFHLFKDGISSMSGTLNPALPIKNIVVTDEQKLGNFWIFHHNYRKAHNGVTFQIPCKVWCYNSVSDFIK